MKTSKIISTIVSFSLVFFMSVSSIANSSTGNMGDNVKTGVKKQMDESKNIISESTSSGSAESEFSNLRFDVNKFNTEIEINELPLNSTDYLRFDVNNFTNATTSEVTELPVNDFDYLRFNVNHFDNASEITELPVNDFDYLRFNVNHFDNASEISELPVNDFDYLRFDVSKFENTHDLSEMPAK